jgi:hypothetical protein
MIHVSKEAGRYEQVVVVLHEPNGIDELSAFRSSSSLRSFNSYAII